MTDNRTTERVDHPPRVREAIDELMREKDATDNRTTELLPCPFCGGEVELTTYRNEGYIIKCNNHDWPKAEGFHPIADENIAGDIQLCSWGLGDEAKKALITAWNTRAELTCELKWTLQGETQTQEFWRCECGNCGECFGVEDRSSFPFKRTIDEVDIPNYCPNCGCKVVEE